MTAEMPPTASGRHEGVVERAFPDYGFIAGKGIEKDVYFKAIWYRGSPPLREGDEVTFELRIYGNDLQAQSLLRRDEEIRNIPSSRQERSSLLPMGSIFSWAYLGHLPDTFDKLATLALDEDWDFQDSTNGGRKFLILESYLRHTFDRLVLENKVVINADSSYSAFNTGLVDSRYETIYALFKLNKGGRAAWRLQGFCIAGEELEGHTLVRQFNPLPALAHYFDEPGDLLFDTRVGKPELDWRHVVIERLDRYPFEFLRDHWPSHFPKEYVLGLMNREERKKYFVELGEAIERDDRTYRLIMNRVKDAVALSIKRTAWNFKTAVPQYYPRVRRLQLLLPLCLISDDRPDLALTVEKTNVGSYLGHTVLPLDWAYKNARLICRPDSDWLEPKSIDNETDDDD
jgi:cold shock CspA family protein